MKIDKSKPKKWQQFVSDLGVTGLEKLLLEHCRPDIWELPMILLTIEESKQPFIGEPIVQSLASKIGEYYECPNLDLKIFPRIEGKKFYTYDGYMDKVKKESKEEEKNDEKDVSIVHVIKCKIELKEISSGRYMAPCPFHKETTPSFTVNEDNQTYRCFGCGANGDYKDFIKAYQEAVYLEEFLTGQFYASPKLLSAVEKKDKEMAEADEELKATLMRMIESIADNNIARITNSKLKEQIIESIKECKEKLP